jgi:hypothetical protein
MTARPSLTIAHLYPAEMNIYGDRGNIITLRRRLEWRDIEARVVEIAPGAPFDPLDADIVFGGGGQDAGQVVVADDLQARATEMREAAEAGVVMLVICGTYQLFGERFVTADGVDLPGIGIFDLTTRSAPGRLIGNVVVESAFGRLVGFENHGGRTWLAGGQQPLGRVTKGNGNNGETGDEGAVSHSAFGTYLHGPVLPKNPAFADELIRRAMRRRHEVDELAPLDDTLELAAAATASTR